MSTDLFRRYGHLLKADGTNQLQRTPPALEQGYVLPDERSLSDLVQYTRGVAAELRFYNGSGQATGDWSAFLEPLLGDAATGVALPDAELETAMATRQDWQPHVALFLVFLQLFRHLQDDLNELPDKHLRHYYEEVLSLARRAPTPDAAHVLFELARGAASTLLPAGTPLDAGKDGDGNPLVYETQSELAVSAATVSDIRRFVAETDYRGKRRFFAADAVGEDEAASWPTFGSKQLALAAAERTMPEAMIGFAIASPLLLLAEGERSLSLVAPLRVDGEPPPPLVLGQALDASLTGAEGWLAPDRFTARLVENSSGAMTLEIDLDVGEAAPAIVPFDAALHGDGHVSQWPVLRILLRGESGSYEILEGLAIEQVDLAVTVQGVRDLVVQNEQAALSAEGPMSLFGNQPRIGSQFYVGSAEVFSKQLSSLTLNVQWQDAPDDLFEYYKAYFDSTDGLDGFEDRFLVEMHLLHDRSWDHLLVDDETLFGGGENRGRGIAARSNHFEDVVDYAPMPELTEIERLENGSRRGFVRLTLTGPDEPEPFEAFGHKMFARRYAEQAIALSQYDPTTSSLPEPELPNPPYAPTLVSLSLDYTASTTARPEGAGQIDELHVLGPWGHTRADEEVEARLVPAFEGEAALYLGVESFEPPGNVSLLFQIDSGTATASEVLEPGDVEWSYLDGKQWRALPPEAVLNDSTYGFQQPGLVVLSVGREATTEHTTMPAGKVWLRAAIQRPPGSASRTADLRTQAALAELEPATGDLSDYEAHLESGLAAESIQRLQKRDAAIKKASQPYASFGGRAAELDAAFFRRCSERLRHRGRAVTVWDFERLVLEAFSEVFKVKCLPHSDAEGVEKAGEAALVIVPDLRNSSSTNLLEPRAGAVLMGRIGDFLGGGIGTPFASVHVIHPVYERILVEASVAFHTGLDAGYYASLLNQELQRFLSPWAFEEGEDIVFGARIYRSDVLAFIEGRDYVDFVTGFNLYHSYSGPNYHGILPAPTPAISEMEIDGTFVVGQGVETAQASLPQAILVSSADHRVTPIDVGEEECSGVELLGIGHMSVGIDFLVHQD